MITFKTFLSESLEADKLKHLEHAEDHIIHGGNEGMLHAADTLNDIHDFLKGGKNKTSITTKYDGSPSIVFGINPENGKFFVASKSAFNKNPKINYTDEDIERNHGHAPGLVAKLKQALTHLKKVMPVDKNGKPTGVYQGDFMYEKSDLNDNGKELAFTPNTITYSLDKDSTEGRKVKNSEMGFVVHTKYEGKKLADMKAGFKIDHSKFKQDPDVNLISPEIKAPTGRYTTDQQKEYQRNIDAASQLYTNMHHDGLDKLSKHDILLKAHINDTVRKDTKPSVGGYIQYLEGKRDKEMASVKTEKAKESKRAHYDELIKDVNDNKDDFKDALDIHGHLQKAKDVLVKAMGNPTPYRNTVGGKEVKPEGFVATREGKPTKIVDRAEFSRLNFANNRGRAQDEEAVKPEESDTKNPHVLAFGRMNPPTAGHGALVNKVLETAKDRKAGHSIVLSGTQDPEKNPLSQEQKVKHAKRMFPTANIQAADESAPTMIGQAKKLSEKGIDHLVVVAGSDRVDEFKKLLDNYNGKEFNFKRIDVVSAGGRDPDAEEDPNNPAGISATKQRGHAINNKFSEFQRGLPADMHPEHARELFNDVRQGMDIKIDQTTNPISLARYAKRNDVIGVKARKEQERRLHLKMQDKANKAAQKAAKKKMI